jgi:hypothetical protein
LHVVDIPTIVTDVIFVINSITTIASPVAIAEKEQIEP